MATFVQVAPIDEPGFTDPALDLARHVYTMMEQDPSGIDEKISDQAVRLPCCRDGGLWASLGAMEEASR